MFCCSFALAWGGHGGVFGAQVGDLPATCPLGMFGTCGTNATNPRRRGYDNLGLVLEMHATPEVPTMPINNSQMRLKML